MKYSKLITILFFNFLCITGFSQETQKSPFVHFSNNDGLCSASAYDLYVDNSGILWIASGRCINKFNGLDFEQIITPDSSIVRLFSDNHDKLYAISSSGNIYTIKDNRAVLYYAASNKNDFVTISNNILFDDSLMISFILPHKNVAIKNNTTHNIFISAKETHFINRYKNQLFCGSSTSGKTDKLIYSYDNTIFQLKLSKSSNPSRSVAILLSDSSILYGNDFELIHFINNRIISRSFVESSIQNLYRDKSGKIWVSMYNGAICFPTGNIDQDNVVTYLKNQTVSTIAEDLSGNIWFATVGNGLFLLPSQPTVSYSTPKLFTDSLTQYNKIESALPAILMANEVDNSSKIIAINDVMYDSIPPEIFINQVKIMNIDTIIQNNYELSFDQNFITIDYIGFSQGNNNKLRYRYRLKGLTDEKWIYTNTMSAQYTTLPSGKYEFNVQSVNKNGIWSENFAIVTFNISKPYFQALWFKILIISLLIFCVLLFMYIYSKQLKNKEKEKAKIQQKINSLELEALRSHMNPHFLFNTLSSIQYFITQNDNKSAVNYLSKFSKLMRKILDNSRQSKISIKDELEALELYLILEQLRFDEKLTFKITLDDSIDELTDKIPSMLIQPYVENAILHGVLHKQTGGLISIVLSKKDNNIICEIEDNGVGREKAKEIEAKKIKTHTSSGLSITKERLDLLNNTLNKPMSVKIIDLKNDKNEATGTRVRISIPLN